MIKYHVSQRSSLPAPVEDTRDFKIQIRDGNENF